MSPQDGDGGIVQAVVKSVQSSDVALNEDSSHAFSLSDFDFVTTGDGTISTITVTGIPANGTLTLDGAAVTRGQIIAAEDLDGLVWTPAGDDNGNDLAKLKFTAEDHSGRSTDAVFKFDITGIPDAPTGDDATMTINEDAIYNFSSSTFGFADVDGDTLQSVTITALPGAGTLRLDGVDVTLNQTIPAARLGYLVWTPAADANGSGLASISFKVTDSTGVMSNASSTITFDVTAQPDYVVDGDTVVNTEPSGNQLAPAITTLADGGWLVTWTSDAADQDGNLSGVYQQRYNADGTVHGVETRVNTTTEDDQSAPAVTQLSDGGWVVTWQSFFQDGSGQGIYQQRYNADGSTEGNETQVSSSTVGDQSDPVVTSLTGGGWVVTWQDGTTTDINQQRFNADGTRSGGETKVNTSSADAQTDASITGLSDGGWVVTWSSEYSGGFSAGIFQQRFYANGLPYSGETMVASGYGDVKTSAIAALSDGGWVVTWTSNYQDGNGYGIFQQSYKPDGSIRTYESQVNSTAMGDQSNPTVTSLTGGGWVVTWQSADTSGANTEVFAQVFNAQGRTVGEEMQINTDTVGTQGTPVVTALPDGTFVVAWQSDAQDGFGYSVVQTTVADTAISALTLNEDTAHTFSTNDFSFALGNGASLASITVTGLPGNGTLELDGNAVVKGQVIAAADVDDLVWTPAEDASGSALAGFKFKVVDDNAHVANGIVKFDVTAVNDNPTAADNTVSLTEDGSYSFMSSDFGFADVDTGDTLASVTITALPANGSLTLNGQAVQANDVVNAADLGNLLWEPDANANGDGLASLSFKVTDGGGATSAVANTITFNVNAHSDAPTAQDKTVTVLEDGSHVFTEADFGFADVDGDHFSSLIVTSVPQSGELTLNGVVLTDDFEIAVSDIPNLRWAPNANSHGDAIASLSFMVRDDSQNSFNLQTSPSDASTEHTITFNVTSVADAPTGQDAPVSISEDSSYTFSTGDFGFADGDDHSFASVTVTTLPQNGTLMLGTTAVTVNQVIAAGQIGDLVWTPAANADGDGLASLSFKVTDSSGSTSQAANTITFDVYAEPDAPTALDKTITVQEDGAYTFSATDFDFSDADGDQFSSVIIDTVSGSGHLTLNGIPVTDAYEFAASDIPNLRWMPDANAHGDGLASFTFQVRDDSNGGFNARRPSADLSTVHTITLNVASVADAPTGQDKSEFLSEDSSYTFSTSDFGFADGDNDTLASVTISALPQNGTLTLGNTAVTVNQVIAAGQIGNLVWTPATDTNGDGLASLSFKVTDSNGSTSQAANTITFDVYAVSDAPTTEDNTITIPEDGSYTFSQADFSFADADGDAFSSVIITTVPQSGVLSLNGVAVTASQEIIISDIPHLTWVPDADAVGDDVASFSFQVRDDSEAGSLSRRPSADISTIHTITFDVTPVAHAPTASSDTITIAEDGSHSFAAADFGFIDTDGDSLASVTITDIPTAGHLTLDGADVTASQAIAAADLGRLVWTPAANAHGDGMASLGFRVTDSSGLTSDSAYRLDFNVTSVADAPTAADSAVSLAEDGSHVFSTADFGFADADGDGLASITISGLPQNGSLMLDGIAVIANQTITAADIGKLVWTPATDANGNSLASLTFSVTDATGASSLAHTLAFEVSGTPDAPTAGDRTIHVIEDGSHGFAAADFGFADVDGDALASVIVTGLPGSGSLTLDGQAIASNQEIAAADLGKLVWTPADNANGDDLTAMTFKVRDSSGSVSAQAHTITFNVDAVADLPTASDRTVTIDEDSAYTFSTTDFGFGDADGDSFAFVTVTDLPDNGALKLNGQSVAANAAIAAADLDALVWTAAANAHGDGLASFAFTVTDSDGETSAQAHTITFDVDAVNDGPRAIADRATLVEGKSVKVAVLANDDDIDGDTLSVADASVISGNGTVTVNENGRLVVTYTGKDLDPGATASITVGYAATDGQQSDDAKLTVTVTGVAEDGDDITGTPKPDTLNGTNAGEHMLGLGDNDIIEGRGGDDDISAGAGNDRISGGDGDDRVGGGEGRDIVRGGDGDDRVGGGDGQDMVNGGDGDDQVAGWSGTDTLSGGDGTDTFIFHRNDGRDTITDFDAKGSDHDMIDIREFTSVGSFKDLKTIMSQHGDDVVIELPKTTTIIIEHADLADLSRDHFVL